MASKPPVSVRVLIAGAGPTGLGAAWRMHEHTTTGVLKHADVKADAKAPAWEHDWLVLDESKSCGGLSRSVIDEKGFTWDYGGHVIFSHYQYFNQLLDNLVLNWNDREREAWCWMRDRFIPYPLQNNIWRLPNEDLMKSLEGLVSIQNKQHSDKPKNFHEWLERCFGKGLMEVFMSPYNFKVWAYPPAEMNTEWMGERVATVDLNKVLRCLVEKKDDIGWGPNASFRFPNKGGTGAIWSSLAANLPQEKILLEKKIVGVDAAAHIAYCADGSSYRYGHLISTVPLDIMCTITRNLKPYTEEQLAAFAPKFRYSSTHVIGFGIQGQPPASLRTKCWMYFSENNCPFYRATVFSNYSANHVPQPGQQWSLMCEVSESRCKPVPVDAKEVIAEAERGLLATQLITKDDVIVSRFHVRLERGYPTPFFGRDQLCGPIFQALKDQNILSRGRFGAWKYEVSNQDHSLMQGVEAADHAVFGTAEPTFNTPSVVNGAFQTDRKLVVKPTPKNPFEVNDVKQQENKQAK